MRSHCGVELATFGFYPLASPYLSGPAVVRAFVVQSVDMGSILLLSCIRDFEMVFTAFLLSIQQEEKSVKKKLASSLVANGLPSS